MTYKTPLVPTVTGHVTTSVFDRATPNGTGHCVVAEAMRELGFIRVKVTRDTISVVQPRVGYSVRYFWPTPRALGEKVAAFDNGKLKRKPFSFVLDGRFGGMNIVQPRPHLAARGPDKTPRVVGKRKRTAKKCIRRWAGLVQYVKPGSPTKFVGVPS